MDLNNIFLNYVKNGGRLSNIPEEFRTYEVYLEAVRNYAYEDGYGDRDYWISSKKIPKEMLTKELCLLALKKGHYILDGAPTEILTEETYIEAVKISGMVLLHISEKNKTYKVCLEAVKSNGNVLEYIPKSLITEEICLEAVKNSGRALEFIPEEMKTYEICAKAVESNGYAMFFVPEEMRTYDIYMKAVKNNSGVLTRIPEEMKTYEMYMEVIKKDGEVIRYLPKEKITEEILCESAKTYNDVLKFCPEEMKTEELYKKLVNVNGIILQEIPKEMRAYELCLEAVKNNGRALLYVPQEIKTSQMCEEAVKECVYAIKFVPKKMLTEEICLEVVKKDGSLLELFVPEEMRTYKICLEAVKNEGRALLDVPKEIITVQMCEEAVKECGDAIDFVPEEMLTKELYIKGLNNGYKVYNSNSLYEDVDVFICQINNGIATEEDIKILIKANKFEELHNFIPPLYVVNQWPEDKIEKFDKKIWWYLTKNDLFVQNDNTKGALVEAILSLGAFEKGEGQKERVGFLEHMATYLPKKEIVITKYPVSEEDLKFFKKHFKILDIEKTFVLNKAKLSQDFDFSDLFKLNFDKNVEIEKLKYRVTLKEIEEELSKLDENSDYYMVMKYIYSNYYDEGRKNIKMVLTTDIQDLKSKNKKEGYELERKIRKIYYEANPDFLMTPDKFHRIFDGMNLEYCPEFYEFFKNNYREILADEDKQSNISRIQKQWTEIYQAFLGQRITYEKCENYIHTHRYYDVRYPEIAKLASNSGYSQTEFKKIEEIYTEQLERTISSIPLIEGKCENTDYIYKVLRLDDPIAMFVGNLTDCCQALGKAGHSCMIHSVTSNNGRVLVVIDRKGKVLSQSWIWRNKNVLCLDNIEAVDKDSNNRRIVDSEILETIKQAAKEFVEVDKKGMEEYRQKTLDNLNEQRKNEKISEEEYNKELENLNNQILGQQLTKVTVGVGYTDVDLSGLEKDDENRYPIERVSYISDSRTQLILYKDDSVKHKNIEVETLPLYEEFFTDSKKLVDIDTSDINSLNQNENVVTEEEPEQLVFSALGDDASDKAKRRAKLALINIRKKVKAQEQVSIKVSRDEDEGR